MEHELLLYNNMTQKSCAGYVYMILKNKIRIDTVYREYDDYINMYCKYLSLNFDINEIIGLDVVEKVFDFNANISADVHILNQTFYEGLEILFRLVKAIIDDLDCNLLLLEEGSKVVLERKNNVLYTGINKESNKVDYPFELLERKVNII